MNSTENKQLPPPPGVVGALKAGLDVISSHLTILLLPFALDALLWFGPRLSIKEISLKFYSQSMDLYTSYGLSTDAQIEQMKTAQQAFADFLQKFNLFGLLRTFPVGLSSLMQSKMPVQTPLGVPSVIEVGSWIAMAGWIFLLTMLGWIIGGLYFNRVSALIGEPEITKKSLRAIVQTLLFCVGFTILVFIIGLPILLVLIALNQVNAFIMQAAFFMLALIGSWVIVPIFFAPHGIFLRGQNALSSIYTSLRMARFTLPSASMFVLSIFLVSQGLNFLWSVPPDDSWMLLVGIAGHAFITTALLAASFIYYRDMNAWLEIVLERLRPGTAAPQI
jgi:cytochrome c biogenesis protein CcdA